jgi:hypothetical protein
MTTNKDTRSNRNRQAVVGVQKHYPPTSTLVLNGVPLTPADVTKALQASVDAADATAAATASFHKAAALEQAANTTGDATYRSLKQYVMNQFKASPDVLADFGFTLPSRRVPSADTVAGAVEKRAATREARHTMGKRQKAGIKGTVATAPAAPAGSATPPATPAPVVNPPPAPKPAS